MRNVFQVLIALLLIGALGLVALKVRRTQIPQYLFLCPLQIGDQDTSFSCPKGDHFNLVVGVPKSSSASTNRVFGRLSIKSGTNSIKDIVFDINKSSKGNWLDKRNLTAYIITLPAGEAPINLDRQLRSGSLIAIHVEIQGATVESDSLWLAYLARWEDIK